MWKWIAIILGFVCAAFFAIGFVKPEVSIAASTVVNRSPEVVWRIFTDARRVEFEEKVTSVEPAKLYAFESRMDGMTGATNVRLALKDGGTEITFDSVYRGRSAVWRSMMVLMQSMMKDREATDLARFKLLVESEPAG